MKLNLSQYAKRELCQSPLGKFWHDYYERWSEQDRIEWRYRQMCKKYPKTPKIEIWRKAHRLHGVAPPERKPKKQKHDRQEYQKLLYICPMSPPKEIAKIWNDMGLRNKKGNRYNNTCVDQIIKRLDLHYPRKEFYEKGKKILFKMLDQGYSNSEIATYLNTHKYPPRAAKQYCTQTIEKIRKKRYGTT